MRCVPPDWPLDLGRISIWRTDLVSGVMVVERLADDVAGLDPGPTGVVDVGAFRQAVHADDLPTLTQAAEAAVAGHDAVEAVIRMLAPGGGWRVWLTRQRAERDEGGRVTGIVGVAVDISSQAAERERSASVAEMAQLAAEALGVGFYERDVDAAGAVRWDHNMYRLYQRDPQTGPPGVQEWLQQHVHADDRADLAARIQAIGASDEATSELGFRIYWAGGEVRWIRAWSRRGRRGGHELRWGMHVDVTELMRANEAQRNARRIEQTQLQRAADLESLGEQLRARLDALRSGVSQLLDDPLAALSAAARERVADLAAQTTAIQGLLDALRPAPPEAAPAQRLEVLCVEDNPVNLMLVREVLALRPRVLLRTAEDGLSGVAEALAHPPHLLLLDVQLPDISGIEVMRRLRLEPALQGARFVALSADAMQGHIQAALDAGFDDYWTKPIQFDRFLAHIDRMVAALGPQGNVA